jgi:hypothetical protein
MEWNCDKMFVERYTSMSRAQAYMTGEAFDKAEKWLKENEQRYLDILLERNLFNFILKGI